MSPFAPGEKYVNPYLRELKSITANSSAPLDCLIVAHADMLMTRRLAVSLPEPAAMLQIEQGCWDFGGHFLPEAVRWAVREGAFRQIALVGHSMSDPGRGTPAVVIGARDSATDDGSPSQPSRLLGGVQRSQQRRQQAMQHFVDQFNRLSEMPEIQEPVASGRLELHGLFYLAESGAFLEFDQAQQAFRPLGTPVECA